MRREQAIAILTANQEEIEKLGIKSLALFGSVARNEAKANSDVDLLVEFQQGKQIGFFELAKIQEQLEGLLGREVDLAIAKQLKPRLRDRILKELVPALPNVDEQDSDREITYNMPRKDWKIYIEDILEAIAKIERYTKDMTLAELEADELRVDGVIRNFTIIGEAARKIPTEVEKKYADIPWAQMRGLRNRVVHEYRNVDLEIVWDIIQNYLPPLALQLRPLLQED